VALLSDERHFNLRGRRVPTVAVSWMGDFGVCLTAPSRYLLVSLRCCILQNRVVGCVARRCRIYSFRHLVVEIGREVCYFCR